MPHCSIISEKVLVSQLHKLYTLLRGKRLQIGTDPGNKIPETGTGLRHVRDRPGLPNLKEGIYGDIESDTAEED